MQDADLFIGLAGIAGVFVGFGALIAVRSGGLSEPREVTPMRAVVGMGMLAVVAALAPVTLARYNLTDHQVWALGSALALAGFVVFMVADVRAPETRAAWATETAAFRLTPGEVVLAVAYVLYMPSLVVTPIVIIVGVVPELEAALYFTYVVLILLGAGWTLLGLVFSQRSPQTASGEAALPSTGDPSA